MMSNAFENFHKTGNKKCSLDLMTSGHGSVQNGTGDGFSDNGKMQ